MDLSPFSRQACGGKLSLGQLCMFNGGGLCFFWVRNVRETTWIFDDNELVLRVGVSLSVDGIVCFVPNLHVFG